ncbi:hypothetical protein PIB30_096212 [Stylosanthes scabra]|uniref:Uncharacterized protein n=1 Tax=Stylosanthes scabra TaxID=79078 RepID=A0ABU6XV75_9FABA|nr:hypothetical protein [Stylosanthes scabra]
MVSVTNSINLVGNAVHGVPLDDDSMKKCAANNDIGLENGVEGSDKSRNECNSNPIDLGNGEACEMGNAEYVRDAIDEPGMVLPIVRSGYSDNEPIVIEPSVGAQDKAY